MAHHEKKVVSATLTGMVMHRNTGESEGHRHGWVAVNRTATTEDHDHWHIVYVDGDGVVAFGDAGIPLHTHEPE